MKKKIKIVLNIFSTVCLLATLSLGAFIGISLSSTPKLEIQQIENPLTTHLYDEEKRLLQTLGNSTQYTVSYEDLPPQLIYALVSIEDRNFFTHFGVDVRRTASAFVKNFFSSQKEGGSSLTQQLIKNTILSDEKTYKRKIQEAYLALQLEKECSKEEILTMYFNHVYFEQSIPGVAYAAQKYFGKSVQELLLPECAILAGVVKSASIYNPLKYPDRINERKNLVLKAMLEEHYILEEEYNAAVRVHVNDCLKENDPGYDSYRFQSYYDAVYLEAEALTGKNPFEYPLEITTYLDSALQTKLDEMTEDSSLWKDDTQQIGGVVLRNQDAAVIGVVGGRFYHGYQLFSHAYSLKRQPASTMKPIFSYLLAYEYLHYHASTNVKDAPYTYPGTKISVTNADHHYAGELSVLEALGYSKNTSALDTLEKVTNYVGEERLRTYLSSIDLWDDGIYSPAYGIGGMTYGISPLQLAGAYRIIASKGNYLKPSCIARIVDGKTKEILYERSLQETRIVQEETALSMEDTLIQMVEKNYYKIGVVSVPHVDIGAKTGTTGYDEGSARQLGFPTYADKDSWLAGFSPSYTAAFWSGWDAPRKNSKDYFGKNDERRKMPKYYFHEAMQFLSQKEDDFQLPNDYMTQLVVASDGKDYLPNSWIPSSKLIRSVYRKEDAITEVLPLPTFPKEIEIQSFLLPDETEILFSHEPLQNPTIYETLYGALGYEISYSIGEERIQVFTKEQEIILPYGLEDIEEITITPRYEKNPSLHGETFPILMMWD